MISLKNDLFPVIKINGCSAFTQNNNDRAEGESVERELFIRVQQVVSTNKYFTQTFDLSLETLPHSNTMSQDKFIITRMKRSKCLRKNFHSSCGISMGTISHCEQIFLLARDLFLYL